MPKDQLALHGGVPVRDTLLPYARQSIDQSDLDAVNQALCSSWLTTGPLVEEFEQSFAECVEAKEAVAVSNGTAALHAAMFALGIGPGDEVIVPAITFAASANCVLYMGGKPVFADVDPNTLLIEINGARSKITSKTKAILPVDYAGQPCEYDLLWAIAKNHNIALVADSCHALGGHYNNRKVGTLADLNVFSLHPAKHITTGEGGVVTTNDSALAKRMRAFRNHGITSDHRERAKADSWFYEMVDLGFNYRLTDVQCALGKSQLKKLPSFVKQRQTIAGLYDRAFSTMEGVSALRALPNRSHAYHLYVLLLEDAKLIANRKEIFTALRAENIGVNVHYIPVYWHPYYQRKGFLKGSCPVAESAYEKLITLPMFPDMGEQDVADTVHAVEKVLNHYRG